MSRERDDDRGGRRGRDSEDRGSRRGRDDGDSRGSRRGGSYQYQERSADTYKRRGDQGGSDFDKYLSDAIRMYKTADGDNTIRILPPTWKDAEHFGYDIYVHYGVGPDNQTYLCKHKMKGEPCPICDERERAQKDGDQEYADKLKPNKRVLVYVIDRNNEKDGPLVWSMPWTVDRDLCKLVVDKRSGELLPIDHPERGYDVEFERKGKGDRTQYIGLAIARRESDLGNDRWLEQVQENPIPDSLIFYDYDHIAKVFGGSSGGRGRGRSNDDDIDAKNDKDLRDLETRRDRSSASSKDDELTWDGVHGMTYDELCALIDEERLDIKADDSKNDEELADWICEDLKISKPSKVESRRGPEEDEGNRKLGEMRRRRVD